MRKDARNAPRRRLAITKDGAVSVDRVKLFFVYLSSSGDEENASPSVGNRQQHLQFKTYRGVSWTR